MPESQILEVTKSYLRELNYDLERLTVKSLRSIFSHVYYTWKILKRELGSEKALRVYGRVWEAIVIAQFKQAIDNLGINKVDDIPTLGKIVEHCFSVNPCLYETIKSTPDYHVGHVHWCPNPAYGPHDCIFDRHDYYRQEVFLTINPYLSTIIAEAKKLGFREDIEIEVPEGRCRDGNASFCQIILKKKGLPKIKPTIVSDCEKMFIEDQMEGQEPILYILKKQGKTLEECGPNCFISFFFVDMVIYDGLEKTLDTAKASDLYKKLWQTFPSEWVKEARLELEIGRPKNLEDLGEIIVFCQRKKFIPYQIVPHGDKLVTLISRNDPFAEIPTRFLGKELNSSYFQAVASADHEFIRKIIIETKMSDKTEIQEKKRLLKGDDRNEITIQYK